MIDTDGSLDAVLVLKRSGVHLASWTKTAVPLDVVPVMAAATVGSVDTLLEAFGKSSPREISLETDGQRLLFTKAEPQIVLVLSAPRSVPEVRLRRETQRLLRAFARVRRERVVRPAAMERVPAGR